MFERWRGRQSNGKAAGFRKLAVALAGPVLMLLLSGCLLNERSSLEMEIPDSYRAARGAPTGGHPKLDWWRTFRSGELTNLIEEAQTDNFDIAAAVARMIQADAQSKVVGAALLPTAEFDSSATRARPPGGPDANAFRV